MPLVAMAGGATGQRKAGYPSRVSSAGGVIGDDPLVTGMRLSVRLRRDFTVTDAERLLVTARHTYRELNPDADAQEAEERVTSAADVLFVLLEHAGMLGEALEVRLADHSGSGLDLGGSRAQVVINEPSQLATDAGRDCLRQDDVFALPWSGR